MKIKTITQTIIAAMAALTIVTAQAGDPIDVSAKETVHNDTLWDPHRPDSHAPIGVMGEHTHKAGKWMISYRYMAMQMDGMRDGTTELSSQQLFDLGFPVAPTTMSMDMHMFGIMYGLTDEVTLTAMSGYVFKEMEHVTAPGSMPRAMMGQHFQMKTEGWGDTSLGALVKIYDANSQRIHLNLGLNAPTGNLTARAYPMHSGTGTWDLLPGVTYLWQKGTLSGGAQVLGRIHLGENDRGFSYGDSVEGTGWLAYMLSDLFSISGRLSIEHAGSVDGSDYLFPSPYMSPPMDGGNTGGTWAEAGFGINLHLKHGFRLAAEAVVPFYQDLNGPQHQRDWMLTLGLQKSF